MNFVLNMRLKIFLMALIANILVIIIISSLFYQKSTNFFNEQYSQSLSERLYIGTKNIDSAFQTIYHNSLDIAFNTHIKNLLSENNTTNLNELHTILKTYKQQNPLIDNIYCYIPQSHTLIRSEDYRSIQTIDESTHSAWLSIIEQQQGMKPLTVQDIFTSSIKTVYLYKAPITYENGQVLAYITITISERALYYKYLDDIVRGQDNLIYMFDNQGTVVSANHTLNNSNDLFQIIQQNKLGRTDINIDNEDYLGVYNIAPFSKYAFCLAVNKHLYLQNLISLQVLIILCSMSLFVISGIVIYIMTLKLNKPIEELAEAMKSVSRGNLGIRATVHSKDEIGYLATTFNRMISRINRLVDDLANEKAHKKEAELNALQYQIRPHFIYNTLNSIRFAATMQGAKNISKLLGNFIDLLQVSTNRKGSFALLNDELSTLKNYVALQEFRMMDSFKVDFSIDEQSLNYYVPRLILQPLVENSIIHGLSADKSFCNITVRSYIKDNLLYLEVEDDGKGMSAKQMEVFAEMTKPTSGGYSSVGIFNIKERLHLYYGEKGVLRYFSDHHSYTKAQIQLPISTNIDEYKI